MAEHLYRKQAMRVRFSQAAQFYMSRLQTHRQKQITSNIIKLIIVSIALMAIFFFVGLQSIINATVFLNNLIRGNPTQSQEETQESNFYGIINLDEPEVATNSASLLVTGDATDFKKVEFYINNVKVDDTSIKNNGTFSKEIGKLRVGENKIYVIAKTEDNKNKKQSDVYTITYSNEPPELEIETPKDGDKTNKNEIQIKGKTSKNVTVRINNAPVVVSVDGNFTSTIRLKDGENKLEFTATDIAGNTEKKEIKVTYQKDE